MGPIQKHPIIISVLTPAHPSSKSLSSSLTDGAGKKISPAEYEVAKGPSTFICVR